MGREQNYSLGIFFSNCSLQSSVLFVQLVNTKGLLVLDVKPV